MFDNLTGLAERLRNIDVGSSDKYIFWDAEVLPAIESGRNTPTLELTDAGFKMVFDAAGTVWFEIYKRTDGTIGGDQYLRRRHDSRRGEAVSLIKDQYSARIIYNIIVDHLLAQ